MNSYEVLRFACATGIVETTYRKPYAYLTHPGKMPNLDELCPVEDCKHKRDSGTLLRSKEVASPLSLQMFTANRIVDDVDDGDSFTLVC